MLEGTGNPGAISQRLPVREQKPTMKRPLLLISRIIFTAAVPGVGTWMRTERPYQIPICAIFRGPFLVPERAIDDQTRVSRRRPVLRTSLSVQE